MVWHNRFFIFFDNMDFYEHTWDQCLYNKRHKLNYTADYMYLIDIGIDIQCIDKDVENLDRGAEAVSSNWKYCYYLNSNQVDFSTMLKIRIRGF